MATRVDLDYLDSLELARLVELIIDVQAEACIPAVTQLYRASPTAVSHSAVAYGRLQLMGFLAAMGVGHKTKDTSLGLGASAGSSGSGSGSGGLPPLKGLGTGQCMLMLSLRRLRLPCLFLPMAVL